MIKTHGLNHISLSVRDLERSLAFCEFVSHPVNPTSPESRH